MDAGDNDGRPLTDDEAALVFRRATELDVELDHRAQGWDVGQLEAVGQEVGIGADAVRRAVAEVRLGPPPVDLDGRVVRRWRIVPASPAVAQAELATWLHDQLLEPVRDRPGQAVFDARRDPDADRRRQRDHAHRLRLRSAQRVALAVGAAPGGGAVIRIEAAVLLRRRRLIGRAVAQGSAGGVGVGAVLAATTPETLGIVWPVALLAGAGAGWLGSRHAAVVEDREANDVGLALDGALDRLER